MVSDVFLTKCMIKDNIIVTVNDGEPNIVWIGAFVIGKKCISSFSACHISLGSLQSKESIVDLIFVCLNKF